MAYTALEVTAMAKQMKKGTDADWSDFGHGSDEVMGGKLKGQTSTDYFEFLCPCCDDGQVMYIVDALQNTGTKEHHEHFKEEKRSAERALSENTSVSCAFIAENLLC